MRPLPQLLGERALSGKSKKDWTDWIGFNTYHSLVGGELKNLKAPKEEKILRDMQR